MAIKIVSTVIFLAFCLMAGNATYELGFGLYGIPLALLTLAAMMWEVWIQPVRDDAAYQEMLTGLDDWDFKPTRTGNLADAKETIDILTDRVAYVTDAYAALKAERSDALDKLAELDADLIGNE